MEEFVPKDDFSQRFSITFTFDVETWFKVTGRSKVIKTLYLSMSQNENERKKYFTQSFTLIMTSDLKT